MAHGAALANVWCSRPGATLIEIGYTAASMYTPLARQMGLRYCAVSALNSINGTVQLTDRHLQHVARCVRRHAAEDDTS